MIPFPRDPVHGGTPRNTNAEMGQLLTGFPRQALHAVRLALTHPHSGEIAQWESTIPDDMNHLLLVLRHHNKADDVE